MPWWTLGCFCCFSVFWLSSVVQSSWQRNIQLENVKKWRPLYYFFWKKTFTLYYIQLLLDDPRQIQAARPEPSLFAPPFLPSHQTPQYCTTPAANWRFCRVLGCWGPVLPIWIAQSWSFGVARCLLAISLICQTCTMLSIFSKKWDLWSWAGFSEKEN